MEELLELLCFEKDEIKRELPRIRRAFDRLKIDDVDIARAKDRMHKHFEIELEGFRKIMGIYVRELVNLMLAREEKRKLIYNTLPSISPTIGDAAMIADESVYAGYPVVLFLYVYAGLFDKLGPVDEKAEQEVLTAGEAHCGCNLVKVGTLILDLVPKPDLQISWGVYCDEAPKVEDYLNAEYGVPVVTVNRMQDINFDEADPEREIVYCAGELKKTMARVSEVIGCEITDQMLWKPLIEGGEFMQINEEILKLSVNSDPVPVSLTTLWYVFMLYVCNVSPQNKERLRDGVRTLLKEVKARVSRGEGYYEKGAPRIAVFFPSFVDPIFNQFIGQLGLAPILAEAMWWPPDAALIPDLGVEEDMNPYRVMAKANLKVTQVGPFHIRFGAVQKGVRRYNLDGYFGLFPYSCRPFAADALVLKDAMKKVMDIPVMVLEGDVWDARRYNVEALRTRMESFAEMCKISKMRKALAAA